MNILFWQVCIICCPVLALNGSIVCMRVVLLGLCITLGVRSGVQSKTKETLGASLMTNERGKSQAPNAAAAMAWILPDESGPLPLLQVPEPAAGATSVPWAQFNRAQRGKTQKFFDSRPLERLMISTITLSLSISLLHVVERGACCQRILGVQPVVAKSC